MRRGKSFSTVNWKKYLDVETNPRALTFLESRGNDVLWQISSEINRAMMTPGQHEVVFLIHPNVGAVIRIPKKEFGEFLNISLSWFEKNEDYEKCKEIQWFQTNFDNLKKGKPISRKRKEKVI